MTGDGRVGGLKNESGIYIYTNRLEWPNFIWKSVLAERAELAHDGSFHTSRDRDWETFSNRWLNGETQVSPIYSPGAR